MASDPGNTPTQAPRAGWYPDPERPGEQRYWDGSRWTDIHPASSAAGPKPSRTRYGLYVWAGIVLLLAALVFHLGLRSLLLLAVFPLGIGIFLIVKRRTAVGVALVVASVLLPVLEAWALPTYRVPSPSMVPTLAVGDRIVVNKTEIGGLSVGDVVVFHPPAGADLSTPECGNPNQGAGHTAACDAPTPQKSSQTLIKRIVAGPGDRISISNGHVIRNGVPEQDSTYTEPCGSDPSCTFPTPIVIPSGDYFVMGDNRGESDDSRFWGPVASDWIIGVALLQTWPPGHIGFL